MDCLDVVAPASCLQSLPKELIQACILYVPFRIQEVAHKRSWGMWQLRCVSRRVQDLTQKDPRWKLALHLHRVKATQWNKTKSILDTDDRTVRALLGTLPPRKLLNLSGLRGIGKATLQAVSQPVDCLVLDGCLDLTSDICDALPRHVRYLSLQECSLTAPLGQAAEELVTLKASGDKVSPRFVAGLPKSVTRLRLTGPSVSQEVIQALPNRVLTLSIESSALTSETARALHCCEVQELKLTGSSLPDTNALRILPSKVDALHLTLPKGCDSAALLQAVPSNIQDLYLYGDLDQTGAAYIPQGVKHLALFGNPTPQQRVDILRALHICPRMLVLWWDKQECGQLGAVVRSLRLRGIKVAFA